MRRFTMTMAAGALLAIATPGVAVADPPTRDQIRDLEVIDLECAARVADSGPVAHCEWSQPRSPRAAAVKLFRLDRAVDRHRQVVYRSGELSSTSYTDSEVRPGHRYAYGLVVYDRAGHRVGQSRPAWVRIPPRPDVVPDVEVLRLTCHVGDGGAAIGCEWSRPRTRDAAVVTLWRSVNDGPREVVERFRPSGPNAYRDPVPAGANDVTYGVIATSESDRVVARSRPVTVHVSRPVDTRPVDTRPVDTRPVDTRPVDTRPVDTRPVDTRPVDTRPVDTRPVDTRPVDTRPVDTRPVDTRPVDTQPDGARGGRGSVAP